MKRITLLIIILITLLCINTAQAIPDYYGFQPINADYLANGWNMVHMTGSMALYMTLRVRFEATPLQATAITMLAGLTWEFLDAAYCSLRKGPSAMDQILDPRGADYRDIVMDITGIVAGNMVCGISFRNKTPMLNLKINLN
jgi:hypothetical protein